MSSGPVKRRQVVDDRDHRVVVAVRDHAALRRAGRPRGVDVGEEVVLLDRRRGLAQRVRVLGRVGAPALGQVVEVGEGQHVAQARERRRARARPSRAGPRPRRGRRPTPSGRGCSRRPSASCSRRSQRRSRRPAPSAKSKSAHSTGSCRGSRTRRPSARRARAARSRSPRRARPPPPTRARATRRRAGRGRPGVVRPAATASRQSRSIVRFLLMASLTLCEAGMSLGQGESSRSL